MHVNIKNAKNKIYGESGKVYAVWPEQLVLRCSAVIPAQTGCAEKTLKQL